ncbi:hypothetical protein DL765_008823 [Monosporascus sp. GIB2]|nr:hypothetical protein DL765_008823 [Monosporascus sp. GIB2]
MRNSSEREPKLEATAAGGIRGPARSADGVDIPRMRYAEPGAERGLEAAVRGDRHGRVGARGGDHQGGKRRSYTEQSLQRPRHRVAVTAVARYDGRRQQHDAELAEAAQRRKAKGRRYPYSLMQMVYVHGCRLRRHIKAAPDKATAKPNMEERIWGLRVVPQEI